jgi:hypothetical protein
MNRGVERLLRRCLWGVSALTAVAAVVLVGVSFLSPPEPLALPSLENAPALPGQKAGKRRDPKVEQLAGARFTRTVLAPAAAAKPAAPLLQTLIRLKGIMDFGDPKANEALIEDIRSGQTKGYRVGQVVEGVNATVVKVDTGVTLSCEGQTVRLEVEAQTRSESGPLAGPPAEALQTAKKATEP